MKTTRQAGEGDRDGHGRRAFTLLELLVVVTLIAAMSYLFLGGMREGGRPAALRAGQATLSNLVVAARNRAVSSGRSTRLLVHHDVQSPLRAERFLRLVALQEFRQDQWMTLQTVSLPRGIHLVPHENQGMPGLLPDAAAWRKVDGRRLHSSALFRPLVRCQVDTPVIESWAEIVFSAHGTTPTSGQLVVTAGRPNVAPASGHSPVMLDNPEMVRGLQLSAYGLAVAIDGRKGF